MQNGKIIGYGKQEGHMKELYDLKLYINVGKCLNKIMFRNITVVFGYLQIC